MTTSDEPVILKKTKKQRISDVDITKDIKYVGVNDYKTDLFEGQYRIPRGMAYNSYVIIDEKIAVTDTVEADFTREWLSNVASALDGRKPDYLVIHHMEPDHSAGIAEFLRAYPDATVVANAKAFAMIDNFFGVGLCKNKLTVENGGTLPLGRHTLNFIFAPMVHWPEVTVTYDDADKVLFSADAFGKFGATDADEPWTDEAGRYYFGIVGKYGAQVQALLKKVSALDIKIICPLHGPVLSGDISRYTSLYDVWSSYSADTDGVCIAYTSVYGNTEKAALSLAEALRARGCGSVTVYDLARCDMSSAVAGAFRNKKLVLASTTYNGDVFPFMREFICCLSERGYKNRTVGIIENGSWMPLAAKVMRGMLEGCKNLSLTETTVTLLSSLTDKNKEDIEKLASELCG